MSTAKIARGTSRRAEVTGTQPTTYSDGPYLNATPWPYWTLGGPGGGVASYHGSAWQVTEGATVTVPNDAPLGAYTGTVIRNRQDTNGDGNYDSGEKVFFAFDVVCLAVEISATEIQRDAILTLFLCRAVVSGGTSPYTYSWSVQGGTLVSGQGTAEAGVSFAPGASGSVSLTVSDSTTPQPCMASDIISIPPGPPLEFTVTTDPSGTDAGNSSGSSRDAMQFVVTVEATANQPIASPPSTVTFQMRRPSINTTYQLTGDLVAGSSPPKYRAWWTVTGQRGKWFIEVETPHKSNTASFKINKRKQIVAVANSWSNATQDELRAAGATVCNDLTAKIYNHVGLPLSGTITPQYNSATVPCSGDGCLLFYSLAFKTQWEEGHVAVRADGQRVNVNSATKPFPEHGASKEAENAGVPSDYKAEVRIGSTVNLDED